MCAQYAGGQHNPSCDTRDVRARGGAKSARKIRIAESKQSTCPTFASENPKAPGWGGLSEAGRPYQEKELEAQAKERVNLLILTVRQKETQAIEPVQLSDLGILERRDLQEWILRHPNVLGESLLVLDYEFNQFSDVKDRIDILAVDEDGRLVIVELKRDEHGQHADLQALRYAAKLRSMSLDDAAKVLANSSHRSGTVLTEADARQKILDFLGGGPEFIELSAEPRIILAGPGFGKDLTTTVLFLRDHGIDVSCVRLRAYPIGPDDVVLVPERLIPIPETEEYLAKVEVKQRRVEAAQSRRLPEALRYLVDKGVVEDGQGVQLRHHLIAGIRFVPDDPRFSATIVARPGERPKLKWRHDGQEYTISALTAIIFNQMRTDGKVGEAYSGAYYWGGQDESLWDLAARQMRSDGLLN